MLQKAMLFSSAQGKTETMLTSVSMGLMKDNYFNLKLPAVSNNEATLENPRNTVLISENNSM